jgi:hypothetical protein
MGDDGCVVLERHAIPHERAVGDVLQVGALFEELIEQRSQRVVHVNLQTLRWMDLLAKQGVGSSGRIRTYNPPVNSVTQVVGFAGSSCR